MNYKFIFCSLLAALWINCGAVAGAQRPQAEEGVESSGPRSLMVFRLDDEQVKQLVATGRLETEVPRAYLGDIAAIKIQRSTSFLSDAIEVETYVDKINRRVSVVVDRAMLERLDYQPLIVPIFESNFNQVGLVFREESKSRLWGREESVAPEQRNEEAQGPEFFVRIDEQRALLGRLKQAAFEIETDFGPVNISTTQIAGIRFNADSLSSDGKTKHNVFVKLQSGDSFSGVLALQTLRVASKWGEQPIKTSELESLTIDQMARFVKSESGRSRWRFEQNQPARNSARPNLKPKHHSKS